MRVPDSVQEANGLEDLLEERLHQLDGKPFVAIHLHEVI